MFLDHGSLHKTLYPPIWFKYLYGPSCEKSGQGGNLGRKRTRETHTGLPRGTRQRGPGGRQADMPLKKEALLLVGHVYGKSRVRTNAIFPDISWATFFLDNSSLLLTFSKKSICEMVRVLLVLSQSINYWRFRMILLSPYFRVNLGLWLEIYHPLLNGTGGEKSMMHAVCRHWGYPFLKSTVKLLPKYDTNGELWNANFRSTVEIKYYFSFASVGWRAPTYRFLCRELRILADWS